jgi:two-component system cell cycle sensor histidine kinase/response regulator CckA
MAQELSVLLVEDNEAYTFGILRELSADALFYPISFLRVNTPNTLREALESKAWSVVISGNTRSGAGGLMPLKLMKETGRQIPLILLSHAPDGNDPEEAVRKGAAEVLPGTELGKLREVVQRLVGRRWE